MNEEIKEGEMVWTLGDDQRWSSEKCEYIQETSIGLHLCWNLDKSNAYRWLEVTTKDPHEKKCELLKQNEELWEYKDGYFNGYHLGTLYSTYFTRLQGFVVELGNGDHEKVNNPVVWTDKKDGSFHRRFSDREDNNYSQRCKIIGCIMSTSN